MIVAAVAAFFFVSRLNPTYRAQASISTGIMGESGLDQDGSAPWLQEYQIKMHFDNLITSLLSRKNMSFLSYKLLLHDTDGKEEPFRDLTQEEIPKEVDLTGITPEIISELNELMEEKVDSFDYTFQKKPHLQKVFDNLAKAYRYDYETLKTYHITTLRSGASDNIKIWFTCENPDMAAWVVNTFCELSLEFHKYNKKSSQAQRLSFVSEELKDKKTELEEKTKELEFYKTQRNVVNVKASVDALVSQQKELEMKREELSNQTFALTKNIQNLESQIALMRKDKTTLEGEVENTNIAIANTSKMIRELEIEYAKSNYKDEDLKNRLEIFKLNRQKLIDLTVIQQIKEGKALESENALNELFRKKTDAELELSLVDERKKSISSELSRIGIEQRSFVTIDANVERMNSEIAIVEKEYEALLREWEGKRRTFTNKSFPLRILEYAQVPEKEEPRYRMVITAFSGIVGAVLAIIAILLAGFFDNSLNSPAKFEKYAQVPLLSTVNRIKTKRLDLKELYRGNGHVKSLDVFKESVRDLRFAIEGSDCKKFLFTSTKSQQGKTFLMLNLAHTLMLKGKKVLLVNTIHFRA